MKSKYVCRGLISPYVKFQYNQTMWSKNLQVKICITTIFIRPNFFFLFFEFCYIMLSLI